MPDLSHLRADFPILHQQVAGHPLVYFDSAASSQKPRQVIDSLVHYYEHDNANVHRGLHYLANAATEAFEDAREKVRAFLSQVRGRDPISSLSSSTTAGRS